MRADRNLCGTSTGDDSAFARCDHHVDSVGDGALEFVDDVLGRAAKQDRHAVGVLALDVEQAGVGVTGERPGAEVSVRRGVEIGDDFGAEDLLNKADLIAGYGQQNDGLYLGAEASYSIGMLDEEIIKAGGYGVDLETNSGYTLAGRLGYIVAPTTMAYVKLGYQQREFELSWDGGSGEEDFHGYVIGGGMAYQLAGAPVTLRAEATRTDYGDEEIIDGVDMEPTETSVDLQAVYRF